MAAKSGVVVITFNSLAHEIPAKLTTNKLKANNLLKVRIKFLLLKWMGAVRAQNNSPLEENTMLRIVSRDEFILVLDAKPVKLAQSEGDIGRNCPSDRGGHHPGGAILERKDRVRSLRA